MPRIFISYATEDVDFVEAVLTNAERIVRRNAEFIRASDSDRLRPGIKWREWILQEMDRADVAVFFVSKDSIGKPWLNFELGYMEKNTGVPIVCVTINPDQIKQIVGPVAVHHLLPLGSQHKIAADQLVRFIGNHVPS